MAFTATTLNSGTAWAPDQTVFAPTDVISEALIMRHSTISGAIEGDEPALRVAYVADDAAAFTAEGGTIAEAQPGLNEVLVNTAKITQLVRLSNEQFRQTGTANELSQSVRRAIIKKADEAFLTQIAPTPPAVAPPAGISNISGIINGGVLGNNLDELIDLIATLQANGGTPTGILLSPTAWSNLRKLKTGTGSELGILGAAADDAAPRLLGIDVTVTNALTGSNGLVVDSSAIVSAVSPVRVATDQSVYFTSDDVALRADWRIGWNIVRPNRIGSFAVADNNDSSSS